ncbi:hypothetical protein F5Y10DRAFT_243277 [Nemania abortiva]|nr:hypothetical protein F5Y10DRAFT_243277 [Nemania abortiva]
MSPPNRVNWPQGDTAAIQQWRRLAPRPPRAPRANQQQQQQQRESHLGSDEDRSSSQQSSSSQLDVMAPLKYLVRGFLRHIRATSATDNRRRQANTEIFVPSPKVTFLIDQPEDLVCQICQQTRLKLAITAENPGPDITVILPCGHIGCHECINLWFGDHDACPFCRTDLVHRGCRHLAKARFIAQDTIHSLPETLPAGGKIGNTCFRCAEKQSRELSIRRMADLAEKFKAARREAERFGTAEAEENMRRAQRAFERIPEEDFTTLTRMRHHQW